MEVWLTVLLIASTTTNIVLGHEVLTLRNEVAALTGEIKGLRAKGGQ